MPKNLLSRKILKFSHCPFLSFHRDYVVSGSQDGILCIWSVNGDNGENSENCECLCQKQLFGRIEVVKTKDDLLATAHFGIAYDAGCISIRQIVSPTELPVIFSIYQVCMYECDRNVEI